MHQEGKDFSFVIHCDSQYKLVEHRTLLEDFCNKKNEYYF